MIRGAVAAGIRAFLREEYPEHEHEHEHEHGARWELEDDQAIAVRARFSA